MDQNPGVWKETAGALAILAGVALTLQSQMAEPALPHIVGGVVLGVVGIWLLAQANRETPS
jgi:hypothetical protein